MRKIQEQLIDKIFDGILKTKVRILNLKEDEELDFAIYHADRHKSLFNVNLKEYAWDYGIFEDNGRWSYAIMIHDAGSYEEPPSSDSMESVETYPTFDEALHALIMNIVNENYGTISEEVYYLSYDDENIISYLRDE